MQHARSSSALHPAGRSLSANTHCLRLGTVQSLGKWLSEGRFSGLLWRADTARWLSPSHRQHTLLFYSSFLLLAILYEALTAARPSRETTTNSRDRTTDCQATAMCRCEETYGRYQSDASEVLVLRLINSTSKDAFSYDIPSRSYPQLDPWNRCAKLSSSPSCSFVTSFCRSLLQHHSSHFRYT